jgi:adenylate kinase
MDAGKLVPDEITIGMAKDRMLQPDASHGFLLDGFPRNIGQAEALDVILDAAGISLDGVLDLEVPEDEVVKRIAGRRLCRNDGSHVFHVAYNPPAVEGVCDECGGELYQRSDDTEEAVRVRLEEYHSKTEPIIEYYRRHGLVVTIPALGKVSEVTARALEALRTKGDSAA